ncbi:MAG: hypothetical protein BMS9Abin23_0076 [Thermodesulfobacteriota bacterium]|nr:MAG: hypothetical protein BMS9Abin23_0076 [Thermodesulfobacteriota bacterium]
MSKRAILILFLIIGLVVGAGAMYAVSMYKGMGQGGAGAPSDEAAKGKKILYWKSPMNPTYIADKPGKDPMGMDLKPVYEGEESTGEPGTVTVDPVTEQNIGVRTVRVKKRRLTKTVRTVGRVVYDETRVYHIRTKLDGWVEKLYFDFTGEKVNKGDTLLEFYSPKLISAEEEFLLARSLAGSVKDVGRASLLELSRRRLQLWDVTDEQIDEIERTGVVKRTLQIQSPFTGIIIEKPVLDGMFVKPGDNLYTIADLSKVWVYADVFEFELPWIRLRQKAEMTLPSAPGKVFEGRVSFIYPFLDEKTRTNRVRVIFDNSDGKLKPDMYADIILKSVVSKRAVAVPKEAVLLSGERSLVILSRGGGKFLPRDIILGVETDDYYQVLDGLKEGDIVVTSAQFLIDSESNLKEAITKMLEVKKKAGAAGGEDKGKMDMKGMDMKGGDKSDMKDMKKDGPASMDMKGMKKDADKPGVKKYKDMEMMQSGAEHESPAKEMKMDAGMKMD